MGDMVEDGEAIGLDGILLYRMLHQDKGHRRLEVRLGRGILDGNKVSKPKPMDTSPPHATTQQTNRIATEFYVRIAAPQPSLPICACQKIGR
jgi:hypothetical protein